ncbi:MAG: polymorphic toxin type 15 domain-containing protein [Pseudoclavibacter sp.]|nr:polymorphic toxin type 15 domain-containing protein [Pseudoclavibacter sp.]
MALWGQPPILRIAEASVPPGTAVPSAKAVAASADAVSVSSAGPVAPVQRAPRVQIAFRGAWTVYLQDMSSEYMRQIARQQDGLNALTVARYREGRELFRQGKSRSGVAQEQARKDFRGKLVHDFERRGMSLSAAEARADAALEVLAALHEPDLTGGGPDRIGLDPGGVPSMGDNWVNGSLGGQMRGNAQVLDEAADRVPDSEAATTFLWVDAVFVHPPWQARDFRLGPEQTACRGYGPRPPEPGPTVVEGWRDEWLHEEEARKLRRATGPAAAADAARGGSEANPARAANSPAAGSAPSARGSTPTAETAAAPTPKAERSRQESSWSTPAPRKPAPAPPEAPRPTATPQEQAAPLRTPGTPLPPDVSPSPPRQTEPPRTPATPSAPAVPGRRAPETPGAGRSEEARPGSGATESLEEIRRLSRIANPYSLREQLRAAAERRRSGQEGDSGWPTTRPRAPRNRGRDSGLER